MIVFRVIVLGVFAMYFLAALLPPVVEPSPDGENEITLPGFRMKVLQVVRVGDDCVDERLLFTHELLGPSTVESVFPADSVLLGVEGWGVLSSGGINVKKGRESVEDSVLDVWGCRGFGEEVSKRGKQGVSTNVHAGKKVLLCL